MKLGDLTSQNLAELVDIKISFGKLTNAVNYGGSPRDGERSETVSLVEVGVHVLLHGLSGQFVLHTLHIILGLLLVHIENQILKLAQGKVLAHLGRSGADGGGNFNQRLPLHQST